MNRIQKRLLFIYLLLTIIVLILDHLLTSGVLRIIKSMIILSLFIISLMLTKRFPIQQVLVYAILFAAAGDFMFAIGNKKEYILYGLFLFFIAYILLILVFLRRWPLRRTELMAALPISLLTWGFYFYLLPYIPVELRLFTPLSAVGLGLVCWCGVCTIPQRIYAKRPALFFAAAGCLIFISDSAISAGVFLPWHHNNPWMLNIIWGTFIPAWTFIAMAAAETKLFRSKE